MSCQTSFIMTLRQSSQNPDPTARHFRVTEDQLEELVTEYHAWRMAKNPGAKRETAIKAMTLFLDYLGSGAFFRQVAKDHGCVESTAHLHCNEVAEFFFEISPTYVSLPRPGEFQNLAVPISDHQAILFVDGVIIPIQHPDHAGNAYYCGRQAKLVTALMYELQLTALVRCGG